MYISVRLKCFNFYWTKIRQRISKMNWRRFWSENKQPRFSGSATGKQPKGRIVKCVLNRLKKKYVG